MKVLLATWVNYPIQLNITLNLKDEIFLAELNLEILEFNSLVSYDYKPLSQYPFIKFDLSFKVPEMI